MRASDAVGAIIRPVRVNGAPLKKVDEAGNLFVIEVCKSLNCVLSVFGFRAEVVDEKFRFAVVIRARNRQAVPQI